MTTATSDPHTHPFSSAGAADLDVSDTGEHEAANGSSKSVPPRPPPSSVITSEHSLPSVIVDIAELDLPAPVEPASVHAVDVDGLLESSEAQASGVTQRTVHRPRNRRALRRVGTLAVLSCVVAAGTLAGRALHVSPRALEAAALHWIR